MPVFNEEFFQQLAELIGGIFQFFQDNLIFVFIGAGVLLLLIIFQQFILAFLIHTL